MKNKYLNETIYILCITLFYIFLSYYYADLFNLQRHWTSAYDNEIIITYNALLFNSAIEQEFTAHSAFFTILSSSILLKFLNLFGFIEIYKFSQIKNLELDEIFQNTIYHLRILSFIINAITAVAITYFFSLIFKRKIFSFVLGVIVFYLTGNIDTLSTIRSEQFSILFLILSLIALNYFFEKSRIIYLVFFFFLIFCSILNKSQVIFFIPAILFFTLYLNNNRFTFDLNFFENLNQNKIIRNIILFLILFITLKSLIFGSDYKSWLFLILLLSILNFYFFKISNRSSLKNNLIIFNSALIIGYIFFNILVFLHPSSSLVSINKTIFSVINYTVVYNSSLSSATFFEFYFSIFELLIKNTFEIINIFFLNFRYWYAAYKVDTINVYLIIFISSLVLFFIKLNAFKTQERKLLLSIFLAFIFICEVNFMREGDMQRYHVYIDYLAVLLLGFVLSKYRKKISLVIASLILVSTIYINNDYINLVKKGLLFDNIKSLCDEKANNYFFKSWVKQIPINKYNDFCNLNK